MAPPKNRVSGKTTSAPGAAFTKDVQQPDPTSQQVAEFDPTRPGAFDLAGFISGAKKHTNTRTIPVTTLPVEAGELQRLTDQRDKLARITPEDDEATPPRRLSAMSQQRQQLADAEARIAELEEELDGTWLLIKVRGLEPEEQDKVRNQRPEVGVPLFCAMFEYAALLRRPEDPEDAWGALDADEWRQIVGLIGAGQYAMLDKAIDGLTYQAVTPDFFERYSASRATRNTSSS